MSDPSWLDYSVAVGTIVTALGTLTLAALTFVLAKATNRANKLASSADIVVTMTPNQWGMMYMDLEVENVGNATAYEISIDYEPTLLAWEERKGEDEAGAPYRSIMVLKPGQCLRASLDSFDTYAGKTFAAKIEWAHSPEAKKRIRKTHRISVDDLAEATYLGEPSALVQIATQVKRIQEAISPVMKGSRRIQADTFTQENRDAKSAADKAWVEKVKKRRQGLTKPKENDT